MRPKAPTLTLFATVLGVSLIFAAQSPVEADAAFSEPLQLLGIDRFECRCSQAREAGSGMWLWLFMSEPTIGGVDSDGPTHGKLQPGDVIVAIDGMLITTRGAGERFSRISPGEPVELTVRRGGIELREWIVPTERVESADAPELEQRDTPLTVNLAELSESLAELARISPQLAELSELHKLSGLGELADLSELSALSELSQLKELSILGDLNIDSRPLGWFGIGLSFSGSMTQRRATDELPRWQFDQPPRVSSVDPAGPAARTGLQRGDLLTHIDGVQLDSEKGGKRFSEVRPGETVTWTVDRNGVPLTIAIAAEERPE